MKRVVPGVVQFRNEVFAEHQELFAKLAGGQHPNVLFMTCADSRIDPNLITQSKPGDLFICRNAGNMIPPHGRTAGGITASIEYAVAVLGVRHILVCGHTDCGAMKAAIHPEALTRLPAVQDWLGNARAAIEIVRERHGEINDELMDEVITENVLVQIQHLKTHPTVAARLATKSLQVHGWVYNIQSGDVSCYDERVGRFVSLEQRYDRLLAGDFAELPDGL